MRELDLEPHVRLQAMRQGQTLNELTGRLLGGLSAEVAVNRPDAVVVQGDTTTALCGALASFHEAVPVAHVEAGLRTGNRCDPFPEEANRRLIAQLATWHFAPTPLAAANLLGEGLDPSAVIVTGNTVVDGHLLSVLRGAADRVPLMMMESPAFWSPCTGARHKAPLWRLSLPPWEKRPLDSGFFGIPRAPESHGAGLVGALPRRQRMRAARRALELRRLCRHSGRCRPRRHRRRRCRRGAVSPSVCRRSWPAMPVSGPKRLRPAWPG